MVGGIESNVVDGPISWRAPSADLRGRKKADHFGPASLAEALVQGRPNKTMPVYYDESGMFDHARLFTQPSGSLPAVLQTGNTRCSGVADQS